jgi:hypothetical protein
MLEKCLAAGVQFCAVDVGEGVFVFVWERGDETSAMGMDTMHEAIQDAYRENKLHTWTPIAKI